MEELGADFNNSSTTNCTIDSDQLWRTVIAFSAAGGVGVLVASTILLILICVKAYKTVLQRLILYSVLAVIVQDSCHFANILVYPHNVNATQPEHSIPCAWLGFIFNWSGWSEYLYFSAIILYLLGVVCAQLKESALKAHVQRHSKAWRCMLEATVVVLCALLPGLVLWIPINNFKILNYGPDDGYCLFEIECDNSQQATHFWYVFFFNLIGFEVVALLCVIIAIVQLVIYCMLSSKLKGAKLMMKYLAVLLTAVIINTIITNVFLVAYTNKSLANELKMFTAIFATVNDFTFLGGYLLVFYSSKLSAMFKRVAKWVRKPWWVRRAGYGTLKDSNLKPVTSETHWSKSVPYTGGFTSISESVQNA